MNQKKLKSLLAHLTQCADCHGGQEKRDCNRNASCYSYSTSIHGAAHPEFLSPAPADMDWAIRKFLQSKFSDGA